MYKYIYECWSTKKVLESSPPTANNYCILYNEPYTMKGLLIFTIAAVLVCHSVVDSLAIGFEVDTPLDPFLGGISKIKKNIVRRLKGVDLDNNNGPEPTTTFFGQQPVVFPPITLPSLPPQNFINLQQRMNSAINHSSPSSAAMSKNNIPFLDQNRFNFAQIPSVVTQQLEAQLANLNQQLQSQQQVKRSTGFRGYAGLQPPNLLQQLTQGMPNQFGMNFPL